jgi:hypothetical protein
VLPAHDDSDRGVVVVHRQAPDEHDGVFAMSTVRLLTPDEVLRRVASPVLDADWDGAGEGVEPVLVEGSAGVLVPAGDAQPVIAAFDGTGGGRDEIVEIGRVSCCSGPRLAGIPSCAAWKPMLTASTPMSCPAC